MEQYELRPADLNKNIQTALKNFNAERLYIRWVGSKGGQVVVNENLKKRKLFLFYKSSGFECKINSKKVFFFEFTPCDNYTMGKNWSVAYERIWRTKDKHGKYEERLNFASAGYPYLGAIYDGPNDLRLPEPSFTILRSTNFTHLIEITFKGKIPIRKTKYNISDGWDYWEIDLDKLSKKLLA